MGAPGHWENTNTNANPDNTPPAEQAVVTNPDTPPTPDANTEAPKSNAEKGKDLRAQWGASFANKVNGVLQRAAGMKDRVGSYFKNLYGSIDGKANETIGAVANGAENLAKRAGEVQAAVEGKMTSAKESLISRYDGIKENFKSGLENARLQADQKAAILRVFFKTGINLNEAPDAEELEARKKGEISATEARYAELAANIDGAKKLRDDILKERQRRSGAQESAA